MTTLAPATVKLVHNFVNKLPDVDEFFQTDNEQGHIQSINSLCHRITILSEKYAELWGGGENGANKFKGDAFELFVEYLIKSSHGDNRIAIYDYSPTPPEEDFGVDGYGNGENKSPATVQVKFRTGDYVLTANSDHLVNFVVASWKKYKVNMDDTKNMLIVHSGLKIAEGTKENMLYNSTRELNRDALRTMCDNRPEWWNRFYDSVKEARIKEEPIKPIVLREHQQAASDAMSNALVKKGMIILPTGVGKTYIEADYASVVIRRCLESNITPVIKVNTSRILLCFQLFEEFYNYFQKFEFSKNMKYVNFNSGKADDTAYDIAMRKQGGIYRRVTSTTSPIEMKRIYDECMRAKIPLCVFSTYHSSVNFSKSGIVPNSTINDECHNLVSPEFCDVADQKYCPTQENFFFTATMKETDSAIDKGMNNPLIFGDIIYTLAAKELIEKGEMVPPMIHLMQAKSHKESWKDNIEEDYGAIFDSIISAMDAHEKVIKRTSASPEEIGAKILVVCRGQQDLIEIFKSKNYQEFSESGSNIHIYALSSDFGMVMDGDETDKSTENDKKIVSNIKKYNLIKSVKELKPNERAILFHVDMIGEGIDVSGITGVMPFRNCSMSKFVQNIGRASRLHKKDRERIYSGEITPLERNKMIKPCSWIIIPSFLYYSEGFSNRLEDIIREMREEYGFIPTQNVLLDNANGLADEAEIDVVNAKIKNKRHKDAEVYGFEHNMEDVSAIEHLLFNYDMIQYEKCRQQSEEDKMNEMLSNL